MTLRAAGAALGLALMVTAVRPSHGADQPIPGTKLALRATSGRERLTFVAREGFTLPTPGSGDDPTVSGATLQIFNAGIIYFAALSQQGAALPIAELTLIAKEIGRHTK